jgi:hypothetical protein
MFRKVMICQAYWTNTREKNTASLFSRGSQPLNLHLDSFAWKIAQVMCWYKEADVWAQIESDMEPVT